MMKVSRGSKGFTLIELLIVVAIIGILAAIAIPAYTGYTAKAKIAGVVHAMGAIKNAIVAYYTEAGTYPGEVDAPGINTRYGVDVPVQYAGFAVGADGPITATIGQAGGGTSNVGGDADGDTIILSPNWTAKTWSWSGTIDAKYIPKN